MFGHFQVWGHSIALYVSGLICHSQKLSNIIIGQIRSEALRANEASELLSCWRFVPGELLSC